MHVAGPARGPTTRMARAVWAWVLVLAVLLKAAVPGLAASAAQARGLAVADVCSVYGVRTLPAAPAAPAAPDPHASHHLGCLLAPLLGAPPLPALPPTLATEAGIALPPARTVGRPASPHDAPLRWLTQRQHAPPTRA